LKKGISYSLFEEGGGTRLPGSIRKEKKKEGTGAEALKKRGLEVKKRKGVQRLLVEAPEKKVSRSPSRCNAKEKGCGSRDASQTQDAGRVRDQREGI